MGFIASACKQPIARQNNQGNNQEPPSNSVSSGPLTPLNSESVSPARTGSPQLKSTDSNGTAAATEKLSAAKKLGCGEASYYGTEFAGQPTANGEVFDPRKLTAAHRTLAFGTRVKVMSKGDSIENENAGVTVKINDRGPFVAGRLIDLSTAAFSKIASTTAGVASVCLYLIE